MEANFYESEYFSCDPVDGSLQWTTPDEAIERYFEDLTSEISLEEHINEHSPLTVYGFERSIISDDWLIAIARDLGETFAYQVGDQYGDDDEGSYYDANITYMRDTGWFELHRALKRCVSGIEVAQYESLTHRAYSRDELRSLFAPELAGEKAANPTPSTP